MADSFRYFKDKYSPLGQCVGYVLSFLFFRLRCWACLEAYGVKCPDWLAGLPVKRLQKLVGESLVGFPLKILQKLYSESLAAGGITVKILQKLFGES